MVMVWKSLSAIMAMVMSANAEQSKPQRIDLVRAASGMDTLQEQPRVALARTPSEWEAIWRAHKGATINTGATTVVVEPPPQFDFDKLMVLAIFSGEQSSAVQYRFLGAKDLGEGGIVRIRPQSIGGGAGQVGGRSYTFLLMTRFTKALAVQIPRGSGWETIAEFPKIAAKPAGSG